MDITKQQRVELNTQGWDIYENGYTIPLYADEIENFDELADGLKVIPTTSDDGVKMFWVLAIATKGEE